MPATRKATAAVSSLALAFSFSASALAEAPSVEQCLKASDSSLTLETEGRLLETRSALLVCASPECPREVHDECKRRIPLVEQLIPSATCEVRDGLGQLRTDARVTVDGRLSAKCGSAPIELDPGVHEFSAHLPGLPVTSRTITLERASEREHVSLVFDAPAATPASLPRSASPQRTAALIVGGAAVASLGVASIFALTALERRREAIDICPEDPCPSREGKERWQDAWRAGNAATGFTIGGGLALSVAVGLWFYDSSSSVGVTLRPDRIQLKARF